jgi:hypothetical protein
LSDIWVHRKDENFCGWKMTLLRKEPVDFLTANIITANIFIRKFFGDDGKKKKPS